ncbi:MAG: hypothetical protein WAK48_14490 [Candidatus Acidiferrum sp.]
MDQIVHTLAENFVKALVSQSAETGRVAERASVLEINPINGFGGRIEKQSEFVLALAEFFNCRPAFPDNGGETKQWSRNDYPPHL